MGRRVGLHTKRLDAPSVLTTQQAERLGWLREHTAFLERTRNITDTVWHDELRALEALEHSAPQTDDSIQDQPKEID
jgi:hypothetical protein